MDSFWYIIGYCRFVSGQPEAAGEVLQQVVTMKRKDKATGQLRDSANKPLAIYILGQIAHSLGHPAEAIAQYRQVEDAIPDAKKSIAAFLRKSIQLPELTIIRPGQPAAVELTFRNVAACDVRVYRIDLMKFALLGQEFAGIAQINLSGIRPQRELSAPLGDGKDYRDRQHRLPLELKDEGAYLLVCRGENLYTSGLVLVTPLELVVEQDAAEHEVRATVKDAASGRYLPEVDVKITGSGSGDFLAGTTDRRGLFVAPGIAGVPTVIAQAGPGRFAFHRGQGATPRADCPAAAADRPGESGGRDAGRSAADTDRGAAADGRTGDRAGPPRDGRRRVRARSQPRRAADRAGAGPAHQLELQRDAAGPGRRHDPAAASDPRAAGQEERSTNAGVGMDTPVTYQVRGLSLAGRAQAAAAGRWT